MIISCDNAIPHLLTDEDLRLAASQFWNKLKPNGLFIASIRDYDQAIEKKPRYTNPQIYDSAEGRRIIFQVWDWLQEGNIYQVHHFLVKQVGEY